MKSPIFFPLICFLLACNNLSKQQDFTNADTLSVPSLPKDTSFVQAKEIKSTPLSDTIENNLNKRLEKKFGGKFHIVTDAEAKWNKEDLKYRVIEIDGPDVVTKVISFQK